jgi:hypothetical protein
VFHGNGLAKGDLSVTGYSRTIFVFNGKYGGAFEFHLFSLPGVLKKHVNGFVPEGANRVREIVCGQIACKDGEFFV